MPVQTLLNRRPNAWRVTTALFQKLSEDFLNRENLQGIAGIANRGTSDA